MAPASKWFTRAVHGLRSFAYAEERDGPRSASPSAADSRAASRTSACCASSKSNEIPIDFIAGTSVGALIAATYASGTSLDEMERQGSATRFSDFGRWTLSRMGMASNDRLEHFLHKFTHRQIFQPNENSAEHRRHRLDLWRIRFISPTAKSARRCALPARIPDFFCPLNTAAGFSWMDFSPKRFPRKPRATWARTS